MVRILHAWLTLASGIAHAYTTAAVAVQGQGTEVRPLSSSYVHCGGRCMSPSISPHTHAFSCTSVDSNGVLGLTAYSDSCKPHRGWFCQGHSTTSSPHAMLPGTKCYESTTEVATAVHAGLRHPAPATTMYTCGCVHPTRTRTTDCWGLSGRVLTARGSLGSP